MSEKRQPQPVEQPPAAEERGSEHVPTPEQRAHVRTLAKVKTTQDGIAKELGLSLNVFRRHYHEDWEAGREEAKTALLSRLLTQGMAGNTNAAMRYLTAMGMVEQRKNVVHTGPNGGPIQHVDLSRLSDEQLREYGRLAAIAEGLDPDSIIFERIDPA